MRTMIGKADYRTGANRGTTTPARVSSALVIPARAAICGTAPVRDGPLKPSVIREMFDYVI